MTELIMMTEEETQKLLATVNECAESIKEHFGVQE